MYSVSPRAKRVEFRRLIRVAIRISRFARNDDGGNGRYRKQIDPGQPLDKDIYDLGPEEFGKNTFHALRARPGP